MTIDTSKIDIKAVIDQLCCIGWQKPTRSRGQIVYKGGPCPFCQQGTDRFAVFPEGEKPHFYCGIHGNGCGAHGDVLRFVQLIKGYSSVGQAIRELRQMGFSLGDETFSPRGPSVIVYSERRPPGQKWQDMGNALVHSAQKYLWSPIGKDSRDYLHGRGFSAETITQFSLGYWPGWTQYALADWGLEDEGTFWIRPGIIIPCYEKRAEKNGSARDVLWSINQRIIAYTSRERGQMAQGKRLPRYRRIRGSSNGLFNVGAIRPDEPLFVTEGELDAMAIEQETGYSVVATGSTSGAQLTHWTIALSLASCLLIAFDHDGGKGEQAATYWTESIFPQKAFYWQPWRKDVNEMLQSGQDLALWATLGVYTVCSEIAPSPPVIAEQAKPVSAEQAQEKTEQTQQEAPQGNLPEVGEHAIVSEVSEPHKDPVVREIVRLFGAKINGVVYGGERFAMPGVATYQPPRADYWVALREKNRRV